MSEVDMRDDEDKADFLNGFTMLPDWAKTSSENYSAGNIEKYAAEEARGVRDVDSPNGGHRGGRDEARREAGAWREDRERERSRRNTGGRGDASRRRFQAEMEARAAEFEGGSPASDAEPKARPVHASERGRQQGGHRERRNTPREPLPFEIRFLPEQKALSVISRKVQSNHRAIPLRNLVKLFFDNPDAVEVRLEFLPEHRDRRFHQCKRCGWFGTSAEALKGHLMSVHFPEFFRAEEVTVDPPTGNFTRVARCGITGKLLAPPNHHSYNKRIHAMLNGECAGYSEDAYRAAIVLDSTPEAIEQWRQEAAKQTLYVREGEVPQTVEGAEEGAEPMVLRMTFEAAEEIFMRDIVPQLIRAERQVTASHAIAKQLNDRTILDAITAAWRREQTIQTASLFFAVRGGLRSRKLALFRARDSHREEFVIRREPVALDAQYAVPELRMILDFLAEHPGCTRSELFAGLMGGADIPEAQKAEVQKQFAFVTERGYVIEYFNGALALPQPHPFFTATPGIKPAEKPTEESAAEASAPAEASEAPVAAEAPAEASEAPVAAEAPAESSEAPVAAEVPAEVTEEA